jgi:hypothetical protein
VVSLVSSAKGMKVRDLSWRVAVGSMT